MPEKIFEHKPHLTPEQKEWIESPRQAKEWLRIFYEGKEVRTKEFAERGLLALFNTLDLNYVWKKEGSEIKKELQILPPEERARIRKEMGKKFWEQIESTTSSKELWEKIIQEPEVKNEYEKGRNFQKKYERPSIDPREYSPIGDWTRIYCYLAGEIDPRLARKALAEATSLSQPGPRNTGEIVHNNYRFSALARNGNFSYESPELQYAAALYLQSAARDKMFGLLERKLRDITSGNVLIIDRETFLRNAIAKGSIYHPPHNKQPRYFEKSGGFEYYRGYLEISDKILKNFIKEKFGENAETIHTLIRDMIFMRTQLLPQKMTAPKFVAEIAKPLGKGDLQEAIQARNRLLKEYPEAFHPAFRKEL